MSNNRRKSVAAVSEPLAADNLAATRAVAGYVFVINPRALSAVVIDLQAKRCFDRGDVGEELVDAHSPGTRGQSEEFPRWSRIRDPSWKKSLGLADVLNRRFHC
jgi:hypothetical protein